MNTWRHRLFIGVILWTVHQVHAEFNAPLPNTQFWALIFFGTAATLEAFICFAIPEYLEGDLCDDMIKLGYVCIVLDAIGCAGYMLKFPSMYYNNLMWGLSFIQWIRLLFVDSDHALSVWNNLVRRAHSLGAKFTYQKAHK